MERLMGSLNQVIDNVTRPPAAGPSQEELLRRSTAAMTSADAIQRISLAHKDGNFFRLLQLPAPDADELGRPVWEVTDSEISKAYRRLSVLVHPDKNPGPEARQAFEYLNQAYRELRDPEKRAERLKAAAGDAVKARERRQAAASGAERLALLAESNARKRALEKEAVNAFQSEIVAQMQKRVKAAEQRKRAVEGSRYKQYTEEQGGDDVEGRSSPGRHPSQQQQQRRHQHNADEEEQQQQQHKKQHKKSKKEKKEKRDKPSSKRHSSSSSSDSEGQRLRAAAAKKRKKPTFM